MTDKRGLQFTVNMQTCSSCEAGSFQLSEGSTRCLPCPFGGTSFVEGAITDEHCRNLSGTYIMIIQKFGIHIYINMFVFSFMEGT